MWEHNMNYSMEPWNNFKRHLRRYYAKKFKRVKQVNKQELKIKKIAIK